MKAYLVQMDNGETYDDYRSWIGKVFTSYRNASKWLISEGYEAFPEYNIHGNLALIFQREEKNDYYEKSYEAKILEMDIEED